MHLDVGETNPLFVGVEEHFLILDGWRRGEKTKALGMAWDARHKYFYSTEEGK